MGEGEVFFADEGQVSEGQIPAAALTNDESVPLQNDERGSSADLWPANQNQNQQQPGEFEATVAEPVSAASFEPDSEVVDERSDEPSLSKDPALIEPVAVHVTPEPLLVDEPQSGPPSYGEDEPDVAPAYSFLRGSMVNRAPGPPTVEEHFPESPSAGEMQTPEEQTSSLEFSGATLTNVSRHFLLRTVRRWPRFPF